MKNLLLICAVVLLAACSTKKEEGYVVNVAFKGDVSKVENKSMILLGGTLKTPIADTAIIKNGKVTFKGNAETANTYQLFFEGRRFPFLPIFIENANFNVTIDLAKHLRQATIEGGGAVQQYLTDRDAKIKAFYEKSNYDSLTRVEPRDVQLIRSITREARSMEGLMDREFIKNNPMSAFALCNLAENIEKMPIQEVDTLLAGFASLPEFSHNLILKESLVTVDKIKSLRPGKQAPDFTQNDINGNPVTLSEIYKKNKVTMVDFWASWCGPCRAFNPTLKKIYNEYHKKGFEIVGVSLDNKHEAWEKGVKDDELPWIHVSDLAKWDNEVAKLYFVRFVPQNTLVDSEGKILARQASEEEILSILNEKL